MVCCMTHPPRPCCFFSPFPLLLFSPSQNARYGRSLMGQEIRPPNRPLRSTSTTVKCRGARPRDRISIARNKAASGLAVIPYRRGSPRRVKSGLGFAVVRQLERGESVGESRNSKINLLQPASKLSLVAVVSPPSVTQDAQKAGSTPPVTPASREPIPGRPLGRSFADPVYLTHLAKNTEAHHG